MPLLSIREFVKNIVKRIDMNNNVLQNLQNEVTEINNRILLLCEKDDELKAIYKGCQIYLSPLVENPDLMLIGINPGAGYYKNHNNQIVQNFEPQEKYEENYDLAQEIKHGVFKYLGKIDIFTNTVKTNTFFFATKNAEDLKRLFKKLPEDFRVELKRKSAEWTKTIIQYVSPKIILCEGHGAFDYLKGFYGEEMVITQNHGYILEATINNIPVIGCQRMGSTIIKKELLVDKLKAYF
jgi:hypothetical protein